jgi:hypothetical protein
LADFRDKNSILADFRDKNSTLNIFFRQQLTLALPFMIFNSKNLQTLIKKPNSKPIKRDKTYSTAALKLNSKAENSHTNKEPY